MALNGRRASWLATYTEGDVTQTERRGEFVEWFIESLEKVAVARCGTIGLFVPKPSSRASVLGNSVVNLDLSVRQRLLVCVNV